VEKRLFVALLALHRVTHPRSDGGGSPRLATPKN
jgi:hypothetical protein